MNYFSLSFVILVLLTTGRMDESLAATALWNGCVGFRWVQALGLEIVVILSLLYCWVRGKVVLYWDRDMHMQNALDRQDLHYIT